MNETHHRKCLLHEVAMSGVFANDWRVDFLLHGWWGDSSHQAKISITNLNSGMLKRLVGVVSLYES